MQNQRVLIERTDYLLREDFHKLKSFNILQQVITDFVELNGFSAKGLHAGV